MSLWREPLIPRRRAALTVGYVAVNDLRRYAASPASWFLLILAVVITAAAILSGLGQVRHWSVVYQELSAQKVTDAQKSGGQLNGWQIEPALRVLRPPEPLAAITVGTTSTAPIYWDFGPSGVRRGDLQGASAGPPADFDFVVRVALGLLAIFLAFESLAAERASGTLLAVLTQPVSATTVLLGKFTAASAALALATVAVLGAAVVVLSWAGGDLVSSRDLGAELLLGVPAWLYGLSCFAVTMLLTTLIRSYHIAVTTALIVWVIAGVNGMAIGQLAARTIAPTPPTYLTESASERVATELTRTGQIELGDVFARSVPVGGDWRAAQLDLERSGHLPTLQRHWNEFSRTLRVRLDAIAGEAARARQRQQRIAEWLMVASPGALFTSASTAIAGTGTVSATKWEVATQSFQRALNDALFDNRPRLILHVPDPPQTPERTSSRSIVGVNVRAPVGVSGMPAFSAPDEQLSVRIGDALWPTVVLLLYVLGLAVLTGLAFDETVP